VKPAIKGAKLSSVTFIWMQGERDAKQKWGPVYEKSLRGLHAQFSKDLGRDDVIRCKTDARSTSRDIESHPCRRHARNGKSFSV
jgi:hypothetical protein